ncbi:MAG: type VI secretion system tip protein TssI/VgrG [Planctomycetota bacterium]|jgi:type VI secretion system secreted protein VgrG|nr:type VI secretion system tip protein TssI/VgrG [Planctomycetota bacterium]
MKTQAGVAFNLTIPGVPQEKLFVARFRGEEALGRDYRFTVDVRFREDTIDLADFVDQSATLELEPQRPDHDDDIAGLTGRTIHGTIIDAALHGKDGQDFSLRLVIAPQLSLLRRSSRSRIYMLTAKQTIPDIIEQVLKDHHLEPGTDFDLSGLNKADYPVRDYVVQYEESDFDFIHRWMEHEGIFYRFDHKGKAEKIVFCDSKNHYDDLTTDGTTKVPYRPQGGGGVTPGTASLFALTLSRTTIPNHVVMQDYNWRSNTWRDPAGSMLTKKATAAAKGAPPANCEIEPRLHHEFDTYYDTQEQADFLIARRVESINARVQKLVGNSSCLAFSAGVLANPVDTGMSGIDEAKYCLLTVVHAGEITTDDIGENREGAYGNTFTAIPATETFRLERKTAWPQVYGVMHAIVDGEKCDDDAMGISDEDPYSYAEISPNGEYRVRMPFDLAGKGKGDTCSCWVRMAQSHSGADYGMHFPLHVGTEVLISHIDGNPDRPVIVGTIPSVHTQSPVNQFNNHQNVLRTSSGHQMVMDDLYNSQRIVIENGKSTVFEMYGRDFTGASEFTSSPVSWAADGAGAVHQAAPSSAPAMPYRPGLSTSHNDGAGFTAIGDSGEVSNHHDYEAAFRAYEAASAGAPSASFGAAASDAPGSAANASLGRGGGATELENLENYVPKSFPSDRFWLHFRKANTVEHLSVGASGDEIATYVHKDFLATYRIVDREKYLLPNGSFDQDNHEEAKADDEEKNLRREAITKPRELSYEEPKTPEQGDPNLQCYKYTGSIGWQWINCGPEVGLQYGRVHRRTEGDIHEYHRGDQFYSHEQGDVYEFRHNENRYIYRSGNDYRIGGSYEHRNTVNEDILEERFINNHDSQEVSFTWRVTEATTAHTELFATETFEYGLSAHNATRFEDIADRRLSIVIATSNQTMIDAENETRISGDDLLHVGGNQEKVVAGTVTTKASNHKVEVPGDTEVKAGASTFIFKDGFTIKQSSAGAKPAPQDVEGKLSGKGEKRLQQAETMIDDAYEQGKKTDKHQKPKDIRKQEAVSPEAAGGGGNGIAMEAKQIQAKSKGIYKVDATKNITVATKMNYTLTANSQVKISGKSKVEIKGAQVHIG